MFFNASRLHVADLGEQRGYLSTCLSTEILQRLNRVADQNTPIWPNYTTSPGGFRAWDGHPNCMNALDHDFKIRYPITSRRNELFSSSHPKGQPMSTHINNILAKADEADFYKATPEELLATLIVCTCSDELLKKKLLEADRPTVTSITTMTEAYERQSNTIKTTETHTSYAVGQQSYDKRRNWQPRRSSESPREGICYRCGNPGHAAPDCKHKLTGNCSNCGKRGHATKACRSRLTRPDNRRDNNTGGPRTKQYPARNKTYANQCIEDRLHTERPSDSPLHSGQPNLRGEVQYRYEDTTIGGGQAHSYSRNEAPEEVARVSMARTHAATPPLIL